MVRVASVVVGGERVEIEIVIYEGFDELDAIAPFEVLRNASQAGARFSTRLVTHDGRLEIKAAHGLRLRAEGTLAQDGIPDLLIVPGGGWNNGAAEGARAEVERGEIPRAIARLHEAGSAISSVCTGAMLLAAAGIIKGRPATTHHSALEDLRSYGATITDARVVDDGDLITAGGVTAGLDLTLWLVERFADETVAQKMSEQMEYRRQGSVWRRQIEHVAAIR